jgi:hypothetical protein
MFALAAEKKLNVKIEVEYMQRTADSLKGWTRLRILFQYSIILGNPEPAWKHRDAINSSTAGFSVAQPSDSNFANLDKPKTNQRDARIGEEIIPELRWTRRLILWIGGIMSVK